MKQQSALKDLQRQFYQRVREKEKRGSLPPGFARGVLNDFSSCFICEKFFCCFLFAISMLMCFSCVVVLASTFFICLSYGVRGPGITGGTGISQTLGDQPRGV